MLTDTNWTDIVARVRGLGSRLLGRQALEQLATSHDLASLAKALDTTSYRGAASGGLTAATLERRLRRAAGARLAVIADWAGDRAPELGTIFDGEDRHNLQALCRAIVTSAPLEERTCGLLPTPTLPSDALEELARQSRLRDIAALLMSWENPYGSALMTEAMRPHPDLFVAQLAMARAYAARALADSSDANDAIQHHARTQIDAENARVAIAAASGALAHHAGSLFIEGGELINRGEFNAVLVMPIDEVRARLARLFAGTVLAPLVPERGPDGDVAMLTAQLRELHRTVRADPLSLATVLEFVLRLRAEVQDLSRIIWGISLRVPRRRIIAGMVTP
jgi:vacuolar-type H+-ATPase subunit C/Vma6